jgi:protein phosphatase
MAEALKIRLAARCEAAGRPENEDNFQVAEDLSVSNTGFTTDKVFSLGSKGTLLLVCDGMGGMNAGEVASAIGVETIKNLFAPQLLTEDVLANDESVCMYMKRAIVKADSQIKEEASKDAAKQGMGSTAVMAWLLGHKVYVAWCGDSRCYRYNPSSNLEQLSHDHSYVQDLVDTGQLSADLAFDHPNKNIITRSLGDPRSAAKPDAKVYTLQKGDVIMLCSDGLSDSLRDSEIEQSIARSIASMESCRDALWNDSKQAGWHDNVTIVLAQVIDEKSAQPKPQPKPQPQPMPQVEVPVTPAPSQKTVASENTNPVHNVSTPSAKNESGKKKLNWKIIIPIIALVILAVVISIFSLSGNNSVEKVEARIEQIVNPKATEIPDNMEADILNELKKNSKANDFAIDKIDEKKCTITSSGLLNDSDKADRIATLDAIISNIKEKKQ